MEDERSSWAAPLPRGVGDRVRALALPALLVAIATLGVVRHIAVEQSSWQGATFGMFATYDNRTSRTIVITLTEPEGERRVAVPPELRDDARRLGVVPTEAGARALARRVLALADDATAVSIEVWRLDLDDDEAGLRIGTDVITSVRVQR